MSNRQAEEGWDERVIAYCDGEMTAAEVKAFEALLEDDVDLSDQVEAYQKLKWIMRNKDDDAAMADLKRLEDLVATARKSRRPEE
jgi:hypothetical protein